MARKLDLWIRFSARICPRVLLPISVLFSSTIATFSVGRWTSFVVTRPLNQTHAGKPLHSSFRRTSAAKLERHRDIFEFAPSFVAVLTRPVQGLPFNSKPRMRIACCMISPAILRVGLCQFKTALKPNQDIDDASQATTNSESWMNCCLVTCSTDMLYIMQCNSVRCRCSCMFFQLVSA